MIPLRDHNPTHHVAYITVALIVVNIVVFAFIQPRSGVEQIVLPNGTATAIDAEARFTFEYAVIPCEITSGRQLDLEEIGQALGGVSEVCDDDAGPALFPDKAILVAALTSMFLHGDWFHLLFNVWFLWIFGNNIEDHVGPVKYLSFYLLAGIVALVAHIALQTNSSIPVIGASGAVAGVMGAYLIWFPVAPVKTLVFVFPINVPAALLLVIWFATQFVTDQNAGIAWAAHVGGFAFGAAVGAVIRFVPPLCRLVWREPWKSRASGRWDSSGGIGVAKR